MAFEWESARDKITWDTPIGDRNSEGIWHIRVKTDEQGYTRQICPFHKPPHVLSVILLGDYACSSCPYFVGKSHSYKLLLCKYPSTEFKVEFATEEELNQRNHFLTHNRILISVD